MGGCSIILGCGGQDAQNLSQFLLSSGKRVVGMVRRSSQPRRYLQPLVDQGLELVNGDLTDISSLYSIFRKYKPEHIYATGSMSHVGVSFEQPLSTFDITGKGILNVLEAMKSECPEAKMYNAASSEMFGSNYSIQEDYDQYDVINHYNFKKHGNRSNEFSIDFQKRHYPEEYNRYIPFQDEESPMMGNSPYGISKLAAYQFTRLYRDSYKMFCCSGVLFNHEGVYRSLTFVTRKITNYVSRLALAKKKNIKIEKLKLGNIDSFRDWMDSRDAVRAMILMLNADIADDYVVGTGLTWSVRDFAKIAFGEIDETYEEHIEIDPSLFRPCEVDYLRANPTKIKEKLGWEPKISFQQMIIDMVSHDIERTEKIYKNYGNI